MTAQSQRRVKVHFEGRVQGVNFRATTRAIAKDHPVVGYVKNLPDGRVELVAEGEPASLDAFVQAVLQRMGSFITGHTRDEQPATGEFGQPGADAFRIAY